MLDFLFDCMMNILMIPVSFVLGVIATKIINWVNKKRCERFWLLKPKEPALVVTANTDSYDENERTALGYVSDYMGAALIIQKVESLFHNHVNVLMEHKIRLKHKKQNHLIIMGGPVHNPICKELFFNGKKSLVQIPFHFDGFVLVDEKEKKRYRSTLDKEKNYFETDYALLINCESPYQAGKRVIAICGCRSIGSYGATKFLTQFYRQYRELRSLKSDYALVLKCEGDEKDLIDVPQLLKVYSLEGVSTHAIRCRKAITEEVPEEADADQGQDR